jgi:hypothetical protein
MCAGSSAAVTLATKVVYRKAKPWAWSIYGAERAQMAAAEGES